MQTRGGVLEQQAQALAQQLRWHELVALARAWCVKDPRTVQAWRYLAAAQFELGEFRAAAEAGAKLVALSPGNAAVLAAQGQLCLQANDFAAASEAFDAAERIDGTLPELLAGKARLLAFEGKIEAAIAYAKRAIAADPMRADAYWSLALTNRGRFDEREFAALSRLASGRERGEGERAMAGFALGHGYEARGNISAAFAAFSNAHALKLGQAAREGLRYDPARTGQRFTQLIEQEIRPVGMRPATALRPVFIVGMPRSGTTLIESMLAAHSRVFAGGERAQMTEIFHAYLATLPQGFDAAQMADFAARYFEGLPAPGAKDVLTDKFPLNLEAAGLIAQMFPDAVILYTRRNPVETGLSVWRHEFSKHWRFANRLEDIGHYMGQCAKLADHWQRVLGPRFVTVQYEEFTANFAAEAPKLVRACGLEWEERCANFQSAEIRMATLSAAQVREAVAPAKPRAPAYGKHLAPLIDALSKAGVDLETGRLV